MTIKNAATSAVLALLFLSLLAIYIINPPNGLITFLSVLIMLVGLIMSQSRSWRDIGILAIIAALVSLVAAALVGNARFGTLGTVVTTLVWGLILMALFSWGQRNILTVPRDRAILIVNRYNGLLHVAEGPIAPPLVPFVETKLAVIPLYELNTLVHLEKINTRARHNIDAIDVHVHYRVIAPRRALGGIPNRSQAQSKIAEEMRKELNEARRDVIFWERLLHYQMELEVDDIVRAVIYNNVVAQNALEIYTNREALAEMVRERLSKLVERWGVSIINLEIERIDVNPEIFRGINKAFVREDDTTLKRIEAEREATRIVLTGAAQAESEAMRVEKLVSAVQKAGIDLSPADLREIVIDALRASSDMGFESIFARPVNEPPPALRPAGDKKDNGAKK
jgi:regulator of protease activity HflC (stomatin/prohibitin superfamily)